MSRFVSIWFPYLKTDWFALQNSEWNQSPFIVSVKHHGRYIITALNEKAAAFGAAKGMVVADARAVIPNLIIKTDWEGLEQKLLTKLANWCIRFSPIVSIDIPDGILINASGCTHLWGSEQAYIQDIKQRLEQRGYQVRISIADSIGAAWALSHYGQVINIVSPGDQTNCLADLSPAALRINDETHFLLSKLGLNTIRQLIQLPRSSLNRRFGKQLVYRLYQAMGLEEETLIPVFPQPLHQEYLPCLEPIVTATGIEIALKQLLETTCTKLIKQEKGIREVRFQCFKMDNNIESITIKTSYASAEPRHLFKLFESKIASLAPEPGIEVFTLDILKTDDLVYKQKNLLQTEESIDLQELGALTDRLRNRIGKDCMIRYLPAERYWPEEACTATDSLTLQAQSAWHKTNQRPIFLLQNPQLIEVTAPVPDYPPMHFRYKGSLYKVKRSQGPERIEAEWWIKPGLHRDYFMVEDETGNRYWIFRLGHYGESEKHQWFIHGFFA